MTIDTHTDPLPTSAGADYALERVIAQARERGAWKLVGGSGKEDAIADAEGNALFSVEHIPFRYAYQIATMPAAITELARRLEGAEREREALRSQLQELKEEARLVVEGWDWIGEHQGADLRVEGPWEEMSALRQLLSMTLCQPPESEATDAAQTP